MKLFILFLNDMYIRAKFARRQLQQWKTDKILHKFNSRRRCRLHIADCILQIADSFRFLII